MYRSFGHIDSQSIYFVSILKQFGQNYTIIQNNMSNLNYKIDVLNITLNLT